MSVASAGQLAAAGYNHGWSTQPLTFNRCPLVCLFSHRSGAATRRERASSSPETPRIAARTSSARTRQVRSALVRGVWRGREASAGCRPS